MMPSPEPATASPTIVPAASPAADPAATTDAFAASTVAHPDVPPAGEVSITLISLLYSSLIYIVLYGGYYTIATCSVAHSNNRLMTSARGTFRDEIGSQQFPTECVGPMSSTNCGSKRVNIVFLICQKWLLFSFVKMVKQC